MRRYLTVLILAVLAPAFLCKGQVVGCAVNGVWYLLGNILLIKHHLVGFLGLCFIFIISAYNCVALFLGSAVKVVPG